MTTVLTSTDEYIKSDNAKFHDFIVKKFYKYKEDMKKVQEKNCKFYRKSTTTCGKKTVSLFPYQKLVRSFINDKTPYRGILVYHMLGSGKTFTAVSVCENMNRKVIVILPSALKETWIEHIVKFACDKYDITLDDWVAAKKAPRLMKKLYKKLSHKYKFVSINAPNSAVQLKRHLPLDDHLIIVDECHHLSHNVISEGSKNGRKIYDMLINAKNIKLLLLSATPLQSDPYELAITFNLLRGRMSVPGEKKKYELFPNDYKEFSKYFVDKKNLRITNKNIFQERINGLVTYYKGIKDPNNIIFPTKIGPEIIKLHMSDYQWRIYSKFRERELDEERILIHGKKDFTAGPYQKPARSSSSSYRNKSRMACNFVLPFKDKDGKKIEYPTKPIDKHERTKLLNRISKKDLEYPNIEKYSPKFHYIIKSLKDNKKELTFIYSDFITFGVDILARVLEANGFVQYYGKENTEGTFNDKDNYKRFSTLYGNTPINQRSNVLNLFKQTDNKYGKNVRILIVSSVAAEGFSLRNIRRVHLLEPYWQDIRIRQVIGRTIRICSHYDLPPSERKVQIFLYLMTLPKEINAIKVLGEKSNESTDEVIYNHALRRQKLLDEFLLAVKEIALDCTLFKTQNFDKQLKKCSYCHNPNMKEPVYYPNIKKQFIPGNSKCIKRTIDYLDGPFLENNKLYVYDPFTNNAYLVCELEYAGEIKLKKFPIEVKFRNGDKKGDILHDYKYFQEVIIVNKKFSLYNPQNHNTYYISKGIPAGYYDVDDKKLVLTREPDESQCFYKLLFNKQK